MPFSLIRDASISGPPEQTMNRCAWLIVSWPVRCALLTICPNLRFAIMAGVESIRGVISFVRTVAAGSFADAAKQLGVSPVAEAKSGPAPIAREPAIAVR
jgi:hypothetical protein